MQRDTCGDCRETPGPTAREYTTSTNGSYQHGSFLRQLASHFGTPGPSLLGRASEGENRTHHYRQGRPGREVTKKSKSLYVLARLRRGVAVGASGAVSFS